METDRIRWRIKERDKLVENEKTDSFEISPQMDQNAMDLQAYVIWTSLVYCDIQWWKSVEFVYTDGSTYYWHGLSKKPKTCFSGQ